MKRYEEFRKTNPLYFPDAKSQVSIEYNNGKPVCVDTILISVSHSEVLSHKEIVETITKEVILKVLPNYSKPSSSADIIVNPSGKFTIWGSFGDSGCVGRKIVVDTYGGVGRVGGGCFSSKNATKVDRTGAYFARFIAKNIVANGLADRCEVGISFGIGLEYPISIIVDTFGTEKCPVDKIYKIINNNFDLSVDSMIKTLDLLKPVYKQTACYGHFGNEKFSWEKIIELKR